MIRIWSLCLQSHSILIKDGEAILPLPHQPPHPPRSFLNCCVFDGKNLKLRQRGFGFLMDDGCVCVRV